MKIVLSVSADAALPAPAGAAAVAALSEAVLDALFAISRLVQTSDCPAVETRRMMCDLAVWNPPVNPQDALVASVDTALHYVWRYIYVVPPLRLSEF
jgi:hypothetical protein